ncbi:IGF-like family receptor 1 [Morone saxatilis]|uniref:IGF-like family receptor 1 n=1 Tax=Morone saxatilis TaxID=34816 RepID=UPI0015E213CC|nr:IGF-like family receptor 1 [Morone saxatilis]
MMEVLWEAPHRRLKVCLLKRSSVAMGYSENCADLARWNKHTSTCVPCAFKPGHEVSPNCGYDDDGGRNELPHRKCKANTFNDGSRAYCQPCTVCLSGQDRVSECTPTTDTQCRDPRDRTTEAAGTFSSQGPTTAPYVTAAFTKASTTQTNQASSLTTNAATVGTLPSVAYHLHRGSSVLWGLPLAILISILLVGLFACVIYIKRKRGQGTVLSYNRRSSYIKAGFSSLSAPPDNNDLEDILSPSILSAPLQTVLDNLDVLEELVILLDPESHGVKNTKHLASHCSFSSSWITYTYSMRDSKSPLKAVLEGVTSKHPEWVVGHLAKLLRKMERNDAIAVLTKLELNKMDV